MRQRFATLGAVGAAALLAIVLLWQGTATTPASAMEKMVQSIRQVKSYKCDIVVRVTEEFPAPGEPSVSEDTFKKYWLAPGSLRQEIWRNTQYGLAKEPETTNIRPAGKPRISIAHSSKRYYVRRALPVDHGSVFDALENLGRFSGAGDRKLGTRVIDGKMAAGFEIEMNKIHFGVSGSQLAEIWIDTESNLPVFVRYSGMKGLGRSTTQETSNFEWNVGFAPNFFDTTPPEGYADATSEPPSLEEQVDAITEAMRTYAEESGGRYPEKDINPLQTTDDLCRLLGMGGFPKSGKEPNATKVYRAMNGFRLAGELRVFSPDHAYYGKTVGSNDKSKILLRWKLDDGKYAVIFGDLRFETVTAERLRSLEGK